jgi:hypothetical protein
MTEWFRRCHAMAVLEWIAGAVIFMLDELIILY